MGREEAMERLLRSRQTLTLRSLLLRAPENGLVLARYAQDQLNLRSFARTSGPPGRNVAQEADLDEQRRLLWAQACAEHLRRALTLAPESADVRAVAAEIALQTGDYSGALVHASEGIALDAESINAWFFKALAEGFQGQ